MIRKKKTHTHTQGGWFSPFKAQVFFGGEGREILQPPQVIKEKLGAPGWVSTVFPICSGAPSNLESKEPPMFATSQEPWYTPIDMVSMCVLFIFVGWKKYGLKRSNRTVTVIIFVFGGGQEFWAIIFKFQILQVWWKLCEIDVVDACSMFDGQ